MNLGYVVGDELLLVGREAAVGALLVSHGFHSCCHLVRHLAHELIQFGDLDQLLDLGALGGVVGVGERGDGEGEQQGEEAILHSDTLSGWSSGLRAK